MLSRAETKDIFGGELATKTLIPEDLIGLKLQAIKNNHKRFENDMLDIKTLISLRGNMTDWTLIEKYCDILDIRHVLNDLKKES